MGMKKEDTKSELCMLPWTVDIVIQKLLLKIRFFDVSCNFLIQASIMKHYVVSNRVA